MATTKGREARQPEQTSLVTEGKLLAAWTLNDKAVKFTLLPSALLFAVPVLFL